LRFVCDDRTAAITFQEFQLKSVPQMSDKLVQSNLWCNHRQKVYDEGQIENESERKYKY